jgi:hypothetical protein
VIHAGHLLFGGRLVDLGLFNQRVGREMLDNEQKQTGDRPGEEDDGYKLTEAVHGSLMAGKTVRVTGIVRRVVGPYDRRKSNEI